jgi:hypothetical protein
MMKNGFEKSGITVAVRVRKGGTFNYARTKMIESSRLKSELVHDIAKAASCGDLSKHHHNELLPATKGSILSSRQITFLFNASKIMSINQLQQLTEYSINMWHGLIPLSIQLVVDKTNIPRKGCFRPVFFHLTGQ